MPLFLSGIFTNHKGCQEYKKKKISNKYAREARISSYISIKIVRQFYTS